MCNKAFVVVSSCNLCNSSIRIWSFEPLFISCSFAEKYSKWLFAKFNSSFSSHDSPPMGFWEMALAFWRTWNLIHYESKSFSFNGAISTHLDRFMNLMSYIVKFLGSHFISRCTRKISRSLAATDSIIQITILILLILPYNPCTR